MGVSLVDGWVPLAVLGIGALAMVGLLARRGRGAVVSLLLAVLLAALTYALLNRLVVDALQLVPEPLPTTVLVWSAVAVLAVVLAVGALVRTGVGRSVAAVLCGVVVLVACASQVNVYFSQYPTLGALLSSTEDERHFSGGTGAPSRSMTTPVVSRWRGPATGASSIVTAPIPGTRSGFTGRPAQIYLPAAYNSPNPPLLPVLVLVAGQPGGPEDWVVGGQLQELMDGVAAAHGGLAPVAVVVDPNGADSADSMCMDSNIAKADTYLSQDVPAWIEGNLGIDSNKAHWAFGGWSYGGTCALQMATMHPQTYPNFIDVAGELQPAISADHAQDVQQAFGGNEAAFDAVAPLTLLRQNRYPDVWGYFANGSEEQEVGQWTTQLSTAARQAGMTVQTQVVPDQGHSWAVPHAALPPALDWLGQRIGIRQ
ncbi:alpha/beta hydrolase family protein [Pseudonocardia sp. WMMC193]|uniref:alpha/beta hydrolase n=1 Tax=Pseudonocardia sp. WMMC193 TaxID=2911965 RepID=UPI001F1B4E85|nr:alpha/beta hydrolase-fold protein [Pseudonocardia sp. WMMC193]MCF7548785.1 esterase family protein [Pseudonocardia sp. WMMC193]